MELSQEKLGLDLWISKKKDAFGGKWFCQISLLFVFFLKDNI